MKQGAADGDSPPPAAVWAARAALAIAFALFLFGVVRLGATAAAGLGHPYAFDYGEGVVWNQMLGLLAGQGFAPLQTFPAIVYEYPPLYHLVTAAVAAAGIDALQAGRLVSLICTLLSALLVGLITARSIAGEDRRTTGIAAAFAALAFLSVPVLDGWAALMRIDMLACALTLFGMLLAARAPWSNRAAIAAGLVFAAALYTRQTSLPAPAAAFLVLLAARPRAAWWMAGSAIASGLAALIALEIHTRGGFLQHILFYNLNRIIWDHALALALVLVSSIVLLALAAIGARGAMRRLGWDWRQWRARWSADPAQAMLAIVLATLALKTLTLPAILKSGASDNYLIDWFTQLCMLAGIAVLPLVRAAMRRPAPFSPLLLGLVAIGLPVQALNAPPFPDRAALAAERVALDRIMARIRASDRPVITDDATLVLRAGKPFVWEPSILAELGAAGVYDESAFVAMVRRGEFAFFVTHGDRGDLLFDQRFNPAVADAIHAAYPVREVIGGRVLHSPRPSPAGAERFR